MSTSAIEVLSSLTLYSFTADPAYLGADYYDYDANLVENINVLPPDSHAQSGYFLACSDTRALIGTISKDSTMVMFLGFNITDTGGIKMDDSTFALNISLSSAGSSYLPVDVTYLGASNKFALFLFDSALTLRFRCFSRERVRGFHPGSEWRRGCCTDGV